MKNHSAPQQSAGRSIPAYDIHLHNNITLEQWKKPPIMSILGKTNGKTNKTEKENPKNEINNIKSKRNPKITADKYMEKQHAPETPKNWKPGAKIQQTKPANIPKQVKGK